MTVCSHSTGAGEPHVAEGPEVHLLARALDRFSGLTVVGVTLGPRCPSVSGLGSVILPSMVRSAGCHGNLLWLDVDERIFAFNVGQHTRFTVDASDARYVAMQVLLSDGTAVYVSDRLRFVNVRIVEPTDVRRSIACMGPSVLDVTGDGDPSNIIAAACSVERPIAEALHDPAVIAGVGQRLASEALLTARVSPWRPATRVQRSEWRALLGSLHVEASRALSIGTVASAGEPLPSLAWCLPAVAYGRTRLEDGTRLVHERCASGWTLSWAPDVQT